MMALLKLKYNALVRRVADILLLVSVAVALPILGHEDGEDLKLETLEDLMGGMDVVNLLLHHTAPIDSEENYLAIEVTCNIYNRYVALSEGALKVVTGKLLEQSYQWLQLTSTSGSGLSNCSIDSELSRLCSDDNFRNQIRDVLYKSQIQQLLNTLADRNSISIPSLAVWLRENIDSSDPQVWTELCNRFRPILRKNECAHTVTS